MTDIPPSLSAFRGVRDLGPDQRLKLGEDQQVHDSGKQHRTNVFARAWDFLTRSRDQVESNKHVTREFVRGIREAYGDEIARLVSRDLKSHLDKGRPLTSHRVERILEKSQAMAGAIEAGNREVLGRSLDRIVESSIQRAFGGVLNESVLSREEQREVIQRAIENDPAFEKEPFHTPLHRLVEQFGGDISELSSLDQGFIDRFVPIAMKALEEAGEGKLLPSSLGIIARDGDPNVSTRDEMLVYMPMRLGLDEPQSMHLQMVTVQVRTITDSLIGGDSPLEISLGQIGLLRDHLSGGTEGGEPRLRDFALEGPAREYRDALLDDMRSLEGRISQDIGLDRFPETTRQALLEAYVLSSGIEASISEGSVRSLGEKAPEQLALLREHLEALRGLDPEDPKAQELLEIVRGRTERVVALLEAAEGAKAQGITHDDLSAMHASGLDLARTLSLISGSGFGERDISRLRELGLPIGETVGKFTLEEARLLRESGSGIELGLQYKERGVPIHPRTVVRDFRDENVGGEPKLLGGGALCKPYEVQYGERTMVFKEAKPGEGYGPQSKLLGIDPGDPRMAVRNVATRVVDEMLGFDLVPETGFGTLDGKLGVVMDFARGSSPVRNRTVDITDEDAGRNLKQMRDLFPDDIQGMLDAAQAKFDGEKVLVVQQFGVSDFDFTDPGLRRELVKLQLLDALTAQGDRHPGNYVVELGDDGSFMRLRAIDNDQAFGPKVVNPNELLHIQGGTRQQEVGGLLFGNEAFNGVLLPPVVDSEIKQSFDSITPEGLRGQLTGLLSDVEIEATLVRLNTIKNHLAKLEREGMVIGPGDWGSEKAGLALQEQSRSYVGRDSSYVKTLDQVDYEEVKT